MYVHLRLKLAAVLAAFAIAASPALAQETSAYKPQIGQPGKDVIWVPSPDVIVERMLRMAQTSSKDFVIDLGAGDGKIAIMAAKKFGARARGIEYNPEMVRLSQINAAKAGVATRVEFTRGDIFISDFSQATVLTMYLLPELNLKLRPKILAMRPGTRVVSHSFTMDDWEADEISATDGKRAYFWVVPASVTGGWTIVTNGAAGAMQLRVRLDQRFQKIRGSVALGQMLAGLRDTRLRGDRISFSFVDDRGARLDFTGRVDGTHMEGSLKSGAGLRGRWTATKNS